MTQESEKLIQGLGRRYFVVLVVVASLLLVDQALLQPLLFRLNGFGPVINLAGRQRMLSQRMTKAALAIDLDPSKAEYWRRELRDSLDRWKTVHTGLLLGDAQLGLPPVRDARILHAFAELQPHFQKLSQAGEQAIQSASIPGEKRSTIDSDVSGTPQIPVLTTDDQRVAIQLLAAEPGYLEQMERVVDLFQIVAIEQVSWLRGLSLALMLGALSAMVALSWLVLKPANELIRSQWQRMRISETQFRSLIERMHDGLVVLDNDHRIHYVNDRFAQILFRTVDELKGSDIVSLAALPSQAELKMLLLSANVCSSSPCEIEWQLPASLKCITLTAVGYQELDDHGAKALFLIVTDISDRKLAEDRLKDAHRELEERVALRTGELRDANDELMHQIKERNLAEENSRRLMIQLAHANRVTSLGQLATGIAHEINQPLGAIAAYSEALPLVLQNPDQQSDEAARIASRIRDAALRAGSIVNRMRSFLRTSKSEMRLLSINPLIEEVLALCSNELSEQRIEVAKNTSDSEDLCFQGDAVQIQQVLMNLIRNSIQAMSGVSDLPRRLTITSFQEDKKLVLVVEDTGPGFQDNWLTTGPFPFHTTKSDGLGMGLSISQTLIHSHSGELTLENNSSGGARVSFKLAVIHDNSPSNVAHSFCR
ncbi:PAS sensor protein [Planctopirus limnophila DSM 3776]|uniref:histidine kinase n=1 Tax=Planctopirus limnophila (strain ATCC 43296 / DSM 3776 / IFAM 1008 / Mu 290) TaxID=521674 RepID=D5SSS0_PLAL2|nr:type IV pili methyl-accepting chemotaxis transducer N-terminal domain-containing protein [Planctopirus limnophila]ADG68871.1 PAS sensor protein [Planctopirus limnophila DSM 3776]